MFLNLETFLSKVFEIFWKNNNYTPAWNLFFLRENSGKGAYEYLIYKYFIEKLYMQLCLLKSYPVEILFSMYFIC